MGSTLGKIETPTPIYTLIKQTPTYQIRKYPPQTRASISTSSRPIPTSGSYTTSGNGGFRILADYIFGKTQNKEVIGMTAPVINTATTLSFILPSKYSTNTKTNTEKGDDGVNAAAVPVPVDQNIELKQIGERFMAVRTFSGTPTNANVEELASQLLVELKKDGDVEIVVDESIEYARYNPPYCLPSMRTNEIMIPITLRTL